jgi:glutamate---cysteine ligase / carboxylate-amine ligase
LSWGSVLTLGVEEELMLLDAETLSQRPLSSEVIARVRSERGVAKHELFESIVELNSGICTSVDEAVDVLGALRREVARAAAESACVVAASGSHPFDDPTTQPIADEPHYRQFVEYAGLAARRQGVQGLHVHVGMPDAETCLRVVETMLPWLPLVLALSANSPWFAGARTGFVSTRAEILGLLPRHGAPPRATTWPDWERIVRRFVDAGVVDTYTALHWDIRPHPNFGTVEVRVADQPTSLERAQGLIELVRALAAWALEQKPPAEDPREVYDQNRWAASRSGPFATFVHPEGGAGVVGTELYAQLANTLESDPLDPTYCEAERQGGDDPQAVAQRLVIVTP